MNNNNILFDNQNTKISETLNIPTIVSHLKNILLHPDNSTIITTLKNRSEVFVGFNDSLFYRNVHVHDCYVGDSAKQRKYIGQEDQHTPTSSVFPLRAKDKSSDNGFPMDKVISNLKNQQSKLVFGLVSATEYKFILTVYDTYSQPSLIVSQILSIDFFGILALGCLRFRSITITSQDVSNTNRAWIGLYTNEPEDRVKEFILIYTSLTGFKIIVSEETETILTHNQLYFNSTLNSLFIHATRDLQDSWEDDDSDDTNNDDDDDNDDVLNEFHFNEKSLVISQYSLDTGKLIFKRMFSDFANLIYQNLQYVDDSWILCFERYWEPDHCILSWIRVSNLEIEYQYNLPLDESICSFKLTINDQHMQVSLLTTN